MTLNFHINEPNAQSQFLNVNSNIEISRQIVWDNAKVDDFNSSLSKETDYIGRLTTNVSIEPINDNAKNFTNFLHDKAFDIFGKTYCDSNKPKHKNNSNTKWFDENCRNAKNDFTRARNVFNRDKNNQSHVRFTRARTKYNNAKTKVQKRFKKEEGTRLNDIAKKDSRKFWKHIKNI